MPNGKPRIALLYDRKNGRSAEHFAELSTRKMDSIRFDPEDAGNLALTLEKYDVVVAMIGIPGMSTYKRHVSVLLSAYAAAKKKPAIGLCSHDPKNTRHVIKEWLDAA